MQTADVIISLLVGLSPTIILLLIVAFIYFRGKGKNAKLVMKTLDQLNEYFYLI